jgi:hypothetical protein
MHLHQVRCGHELTPSATWPCFRRATFPLRQLRAQRSVTSAISPRHLHHSLMLCMCRARPRVVEGRKHISGCIGFPRCALLHTIPYEYATISGASTIYGVSLAVPCLPCLACCVQPSAHGWLRCSLCSAAFPATAEHRSLLPLQRCYAAALLCCYSAPVRALLDESIVGSSFCWYDSKSLCSSISWQCAAHTVHVPTLLCAAGLSDVL